MIVIGADTHKDSHTLAAVDEGTGKVRGNREIKAEDAGHLAAVRWARGLDEERVWAIEDCRHVSRRLEQALLAAGERVVRVPPHRMGASRKGEREPGKSDEIDALAVARAVVKDGVEQFPVAYLNEQAMEIRLLLDHRNDLVADRTRTVNRLRWHLLELCPELERSIKRGALNQARVLDRVDRQLRKLPAGARVRIAREHVAQLRRLNQQIDQLAAELAALVNAHRPKLLAEQGCGPVTAAILIGHTAGNERFRSDARASGCRPGPRRSHAPRGSAPNIGSTAAGTDSSTTPCTSSRSPARNATPPPRSTSPERRPRARPRRERCDRSSGTSRATSTTSSPSRRSPLRTIAARPSGSLPRPASATRTPGEAAIAGAIHPQVPMLCVT
jgi:transposase